jgi:hypothetical protein
MQKNKVESIMRLIIHLNPLMNRGMTGRIRKVNFAFKCFFLHSLSRQMNELGEKINKSQGVVLKLGCSF